MIDKRTRVSSPQSSPVHLQQHNQYESNTGKCITSTGQVEHGSHTNVQSFPQYTSNDRPGPNARQQHPPSPACGALPLSSSAFPSSTPILQQKTILPSFSEAFAPSPLTPAQHYAYSRDRLLTPPAHAYPRQPTISSNTIASVKSQQSHSASYNTYPYLINQSQLQQQQLEQTLAKHPMISKTDHRLSPPYNNRNVTASPPLSSPIMSKAPSAPFPQHSRFDDGYQHPLIHSTVYRQQTPYYQQQQQQQVSNHQHQYSHIQQIQPEQLSFQPQQPHETKQQQTTNQNYEQQGEKKKPILIATTNMDGEPIIRPKRVLQLRYPRYSRSRKGYVQDCTKCGYPKATAHGHSMEKCHPYDSCNDPNCHPEEIKQRAREKQKYRHPKRYL